MIGKLLHMLDQAVWVKTLDGRNGGALAEDERQRIVKRANDGRAAARKRGVHMGRKPKLHILLVEYDIAPGEIDKYLTAVKELGAVTVSGAAL